MKSPRSLVAALLVVGVLPLLQGCFPLIATGVGAGAAMIADRRVTEVYLMDEAIELRATGRIDDRFGDKVHVNITSYNRTALVTGEVPDAATRDEVAKIVQGIDNVRGVLNELRIAPLTSFSERSNDTYLTSKVKTRFVDAGEFSPLHVKVVSEGGVVYLLGLVTRREAESAVGIARTTSDVRKVVRAFEYISEAEAKRLESQPAEQTPATRPGA